MTILSKDIWNYVKCIAVRRMIAKRPVPTWNVNPTVQNAYEVLIAAMVISLEASVSSATWKGLPPSMRRLHSQISTDTAPLGLVDISTAADLLWWTNHHSEAVQ